MFQFKRKSEVDKPLAVLGFPEHSAYRKGSLQLLEARYVDDHKNERSVGQFYVDELGRVYFLTVM